MSLISVIATAYRRRQYLYNALLSLKAQTLSKDKYEVVVVKDFEDPQIDGLIKEMGWKSAYSDVEHQGPKYLIGLLEASGDVIALLDDDDIFKPTKLEYVYNVFSQNPDVGYLQHTFEVINANGVPMPCLAREAPRNIVNVNELKVPWDEVRKHRSYGVLDPVVYILTRYRIFADKNGGALTVKRELFERHKDALAKLSLAIDSFLLASAIAERTSLYFSNEALSLWRYHGSNISTWYVLPDGDERKMSVLYRYYISYGLISRTFFDFYPNYYACLSEEHKLIYLDLAKRLGKPTAGLTPDRSVMLWCCIAGLCLNEFQRYFMAPIRL